jgi:hypothetical protein
MRRCARFAVAVLTLSLAACGAGSGSPGSTATPPTTSPSQTQTVTPSGSPTTSPMCAPFGSTADARSADPLALSTLTGAAMRVGRHDCYERFTFEMTGTGDDPGWWAGYRDPLTGQASGEPVQLRGDADLEVMVGVWTVTDFDGRPDEWPPFTGPDDIVTDGFVALQEARNLYAYEGTTQIGLGVDRERPFRVTWLDSPPRLVVDIYTGELLP